MRTKYGSFTGGDCLPSWQVNRLASGIGCENCGRDITEQIAGHECCGKKPCRRSLKIVGESEELAKKRMGGR